ARIVVLVARCRFVGLRPSFPLQVMPIEQWSSDIPPGVEGTYGADHWRNTGEIEAKAEGRKIYLGGTLGCRCVHVGQQMAEFLPLPSARRDRTVRSQKKPEVISQSALHGILKRELQNTRLGLRFRNAAQKRTLV